MILIDASALILIDASAFIEFLNSTGSREDTLIEQIALEHRATLLHNDRDFDALAQVCDIKIYE